MLTFINDLLLSLRPFQIRSNLGETWPSILIRLPQEIMDISHGGLPDPKGFGTGLSGGREFVDGAYT